MFCELLKSRCGLHFDEDSRFLVEKRCLPAASRRTTPAASPPTTICLRNGSRGEEEFGRADRCAHHERDLLLPRVGQLHALVDEIIPELIAAAPFERAGEVARDHLVGGLLERGGALLDRRAMASRPALDPGRGPADLRLGHLAQGAHEVASRRLSGGLVPRDESTPELRAISTSSRRTGTYRICDELKQARRLHPPEPDGSRQGRAARYDGRDPLPQRDHLLRSGDEEEGDRDVLSRSSGPAVTCCSATPNP